MAAREVAADGAVEQLPQAVGRWSARGGHEVPHPCHQHLAVEQDRDDEHDDGQGRADAAHEGVGDLAEDVGVELAGKAVDPLPDPVGGVGVLQPRAHERDVVEAFQGLGELLAELLGLGDGCGADDEHDEQEADAEGRAHHGHGAASRHAEPARRGDHQRVEGQREQQRDGDPCDRGRSSLEEGGDGERSEHDDPDDGHGRDVELDAQHPTVVRSGRADRLLTAVGSGHGRYCTCRGG